MRKGPRRAWDDGRVAEKSCGELLVERFIADMAQHQLEPDQRDRELFSVVADIANEIEPRHGYD